MLCWFLPCRWWHITNTDDSTDPLWGRVGLYQCTRCKAISIGSPRPFLPETSPEKESGA